jgi:hypothetical protein
VDRSGEERSAVRRGVDGRRRKTGSLGWSFPAVLPDLLAFHDECERRAREALDAKAFDVVHRQGTATDFDEAVAYTLEGQP